MGLDSLYCGKWRKISKSHHDLDLDWTMPMTLIGQCPMSNSSELFSYTTICSSFMSIEPLFFELSCTQTDRHTEGDEYSIVAVDKLQL